MWGRGMFESSTKKIKLTDGSNICFYFSLTTTEYYLENSLLSLLQHKVRLLVPRLRRAPVVDDLVLQTIMALSLFHTERNFIKFSKKNNNIYFTRRYKFLLPMPLAKGTPSPSLNGPYFSMSTKYFCCLFWPPKRKTNFLKSSTEQIGHRIRPSSQAWQRIPWAFAGNENNGTSPWRLRELLCQNTKIS